VAAIGEAGERIAARQLAQAVDHRLQPERLADLAQARQRVTRLLQQLQRRIEIESVRVARRGVGWRGHSGESKFGSV